MNIRKSRSAARLLVAACALALASLALAHHSTAMFDMTKTVEIKGVIKKFEWTNPHTMTYVEVTGDAAAAGEYAVEGMSPNYLGREGWTRHSLQAGDKVTMQIYPLKDGRKGGFMASVTTADGKTMYNLPRRGGANPSSKY